MITLLLVITGLGIWLSVERGNNAELRKQITEKDATIASQKVTIDYWQAMYNVLEREYDQFKIITAADVLESQNEITELTLSRSWFINWGWGISNDCDGTDNLCGEGFIPRLLKRIREFKGKVEEINVGTEAL
jgi:hypothetical protein